MEPGNPSQKNVIDIGDTIVIKDFADLMKKRVPEVIAHLMQNGIMLSMNERIDFDTASIIAEDFGFGAQRVDSHEEEHKMRSVDLAKLEGLLQQDSKEQLVPRAPVVVVMGHVDHGKTTLLDAIRETDVAAGEAGGITQSIGAYQVTEKGRAITFIDTPGHEAFTAMRSRGANVADVAVLVVAADDGLKPQTKEALEIIQRIELPFLIALNKIDKEGADLQRVKTELTEIGLTPEEWGGKTILAEVSAKKGTGIHELLDLVLLVADVHAEEIQANPNREAVGTIIESHVDKGAGPIATVLIQSGTLHAGDLFTAGSIHGKVKALRDFSGKSVSVAPPSMPVQILGLKGAPSVGDILHVTDDYQSIKRLIKEYERTRFAEDKKNAHRAEPMQRSEDDHDEKKKDVQKLNLVLKTDTVSSQEALLHALKDMVHKEVQLGILAKGLGSVTEKDIVQADAGNAFVIGFNVVATPDAKEIARERAIDIHTFRIIYELLDFVKDQLEHLLSPEIVRVDCGAVKILAVFKKTASEQIIGGKVMRGKAMSRLATVERGGETLGKGTILQVQSDKKDVQEVREGSECGLRFRGDVAIAVGDLLSIYTEEKRARKFVKE